MFVVLHDMGVEEIKAEEIRNLLYILIPLLSFLPVVI